MNELNLLQRIFYALTSVVLALAIVFLVFPELAGKQYAIFDIAYEEAWEQYFIDCDCTPSLE